MADINITTDFSEVNNLNNALKSTGDLFTKTVDSLVREEARAKRVTKRLADTTQANLDLITKADALVAAKVQQESLKREKTRTREAERAEKEAARLVAAADRVAKAEVRAAEITQAAAQKKALMSASGRAETGFALGAQKANELAQQEKETERLRLSYDRLYAASSLYEKQLRELTQAESLGVISKQRFNKELDQLDMELKQFQNSSEGAILANNRFSQHINQSSNGVNKFGMYAQQVGYQVGDFFVQIQSGTNVLVAFGQQATQLAGLFPGILGAALGIGISLATAVGSAFMRTASDVESSADRQVTALKKLGDATKSVLEQIDQLRFGGSATAFAENEVKKLESQISGVNNLIQSLSANIEAAKNSADFESALIARDLAESEIASQKQTLDILQEKLTVLKAVEEAQRMLNGGLSVAAGIQKGIIYDTELQLRLAKEQAIEESKAEELARRKKDAFHAMAGEMGAVSSAMFDANNGAREILGNLVGATNAAMSLRDALGGVATAARGRAGQIAILTAEVNAAKSGTSVSGAGAAAQTAIGLSGSGATMDQIAAASTKAAGQAAQIEALQKKKTDLLKVDSKKGGGGGAGAMTTAENKMEEIYKYLETDKYLIEQQTIAFEQRQAALEDALKKKIVTLEEYNQIEKDLTNKHQTEIADIENKAKMAKISTVLGVGEQILTALGAHNEKAAKMARIFGAAQALADTYAGAAAALKLPFPKNLVAAGSIISAGLGFVSAIKSGSSSSSVRGGGGSVGSATVAASGNTAPTPQTVFIDSLDPDGLYSGQALINLFDAFYDENDKRGKVFVVAR